MRVTFIETLDQTDGEAFELEKEAIRATLENYPAAWCAVGEARFVHAPDGWILVAATASIDGAQVDVTDKARKHVQDTNMVPLARRP